MIRFLLVLCLLVVSGCATSPKLKIMAPDFPNRTKLIKNVGVLIAGVNVYEIGVGGSRTLSEELSVQAAETIVKVSQEQLHLAGYNVKFLKLDESTIPIVKGYNKIPSNQLSRYVYSAKKFESPDSENINNLLNKEGIDALVLIKGLDHVKTAGSHAANVAIAAASIALSPVAIVQSSGIAHIEFSLLDRSPAVIYYNHKFESGVSLTSVKEAGAFFAELIDEFKEVRGNN